MPTLKATVMRGGSVLSPLLTSLYAVYKGESNATDSLATYNGTAQGGLTYSAGKSGNAFTFNGTTSAITLPTNSMNSLTGDFSLSLWWYINGTVPSGVALFSAEYLNAGKLYGFHLLSGASQIMNVYICNGVNTTQIGLAGKNYTGLGGQWHHVVVTRKASTGTKYYNNGVLISSDTSTQNPVFTSGVIPSIGGNYLNGSLNYPISNLDKIDEVNIWNKELSSTEVTELYNTGSGKFYPY